MRPGRAAGGPATPIVGTRPTAGADDGFRPWHFFVLASILLATVAVILARQSSPENLILISLTIAAAGAAAARLLPHAGAADRAVRPADGASR